jgi:hypothetical protein
MFANIGQLISRFRVNANLKAYEKRYGIIRNYKIIINHTIRTSDYYNVEFACQEISSGAYLPSPPTPRNNSFVGAW